MPSEVGPFPVLIMTSFGNERVAVDALKAGALDYIVKSPESFAEIPRIVVGAPALLGDTLFQEAACFTGAVEQTP